MNPLNRLREKSYGRIVENTIMLAVMQFSNILLTMLTSGYQTRTFGRDNFNILSAATMYMSFFQLFIDFGFAISATGKIAKNRDNREMVNRIFTCVTIAKAVFIGLSCAAMPLIFQNRFTTWQTELAYWMALLSVSSFALLPDFVYRGYERMTAITLRSVSIKVFATILIFVFIREETDYYMVPMFTLIGNIGAIAVVYTHLFRKMNVRFCRVGVRDVLHEVRESSLFFLSRIASTVYGRVNGVILDLFNPVQVGYYNQATYVVDAARNGLVSPIADSIYPNLMKSRNFSIIKKTLKLTVPIMIAGCTVVFIFAEPLCVLWLGEEMGVGTAQALRALLPVVVISLPNYILGFPTLSPMGLSRHANNSITLGTVLHLINLTILYFTGNVNMVNLGILTCVAEASILIYRIVVIYRNRHLMKPGAVPPPLRSGVGFYVKVKRRVCWRLFSFLPKRPRKAVFQSFNGRGYSDSPKAIARALLEHGGYRIYWVVKNDAEARTLPEGITPVRLDSVRSIYHLCTAGVWVDNSRKWSFTQKRKGQFYIQTWHGFPLKRIERDAEDALPRDYVVSARKDSRMCDLMLSNSRFLTQVYQNGFWYGGEILEGGFPRNDVLVSGDDEAVKRAREALALPQDCRFLLYAPTFRREMGLEVYDVDYARVVGAMEARFGGKWLILAKLHPNIAARAEELRLDGAYVHNVSAYPDIQDLYLLADAMVTDYSSVMFDFMVTGKPCFLYVNDLAAYRDDRNFYYDIDELPFARAEDNDGLQAAISEFDPQAQASRVEAFCEAFGIFESGHAAEAAVDAIVNRTINKKVSEGDG